MALQDIEVKAKELDLEIQKLSELTDAGNLDTAKIRDELIKAKEKMIIAAYENLSSYDRVYIARKASRPNAREYIENLFDNFFEQRGDRLYRDDGAIIGGIASFAGLPVSVIATLKGRNLQDNLKCNFGMANPEGYRKALRLMKQAEKFHRPVLCIVDTSGAYCGLGAEERGQGQAIAENLMEMMTLKTPIISLLIGEGGSGGALALAVADQVWMMENAIYSVISPEGCASILWKDSKKMKEAARHLKLTALDLLGMGVIEQVIPEDDPQDFTEVYQQVQTMLYDQFQSSLQKPVEELLQQRYQRFRMIGIQ